MAFRDRPREVFFPDAAGCWGVEGGGGGGDGRRRAQGTVRRAREREGERGLREERTRREAPR